MIQAATQDAVTSMGWKGCALLVMAAGGVGGALNAYFADHGLARPKVINGIWCPGAIGNIVVGAVSSIVSWALYGSGAVVDIAKPNPRELISLRLTALAGALLVGVAGARWLSNQVDKALLDEAVRKTSSPELKNKLKECDTPQKVLQAVAGGD
jgi:membrane associated rhomboid family serine protease